MYDEVLKRLDEWRHFPKYQLERHVDIFFSFHIKRILEVYFEKKPDGPIKIKLDDLVIPEFPVAKKVLDAKHKHHDAISVDFVLFSKDKSMVFFVELKTDIGSGSKKQNSDMRSICEKEFKDIIEELREIIVASKNRKKYLLLLKKLSLKNVISVDPKIFTAKQICKDYINSIAVHKNMKCKSVLLSPKPKPSGINDVIDVIDFSFIVANQKLIFDDKEGLDFAEYIKKWIASPEEDVYKYVN